MDLKNMFNGIMIVNFFILMSVSIVYINNATDFVIKP